MATTAIDSCNGYGSSCQLDGVQYDGMTSKLVASSEIVPCQSYHMHISVCNVGDNAFDSGVFLEGNSFYSPSAQIGLSQWTVDTIHRSTPLAIPLTLANTEYDQGTIFVNFGGEAVSGVDFLCMSDDGTVVNNGESFTVDNNVRTLTIMPLANANLNNPKSLSVYFSTALCVEYPELLTYDTMLFVLTKDPGETNSIEAVVAGDDGMVVYPNPATTELILRTATAMKYVSIVDASGREVMYTATAQGTTTLRMNIGALQSGAYTVRVVTEDGELVRHVVKQ